MKIRQGFVSNSSSSSFMIFGAYVTISDIIKSEDNDCDDVEVALEGTGLTFSFGASDYHEEVCVGRSYSSIKDDETGKQFKNDVEEKLEKLVGHKVSCSLCQEAWYNG